MSIPSSMKKPASLIFGSLINQAQACACGGPCVYNWNQVSGAWDFDAASSGPCEEGGSCHEPPSAMTEACRQYSELTGNALQSHSSCCTGCAPELKESEPSLVPHLVQILESLRFWYRLALGLGLISILLAAALIYKSMR